MVGSRTLRTCTSHAKIRPMTALIEHEGGPGDVQVVGIDADEPHRARPTTPGDPFAKIFPLVDLGIGRKACCEIIRSAGLCVPEISGCWHCPFMRKREVLQLAKDHAAKRVG